MKTINTFIIEKLKINKDSKKVYNAPTFKIELPRCEDPYNDEFDLNGPTWKTLELPQHNLVIYNDFYRGQRPHLTDICDLVGTIMAFQDDYENFDFKKDILYSSNDIKDIVEWYFINIFKMDKKDFPDNYEDIDDWYDYITHDSSINKKSGLDNLYVLGEFYMGLDYYYNEERYKKSTGKYINYNNPKEMLEKIVKAYF